MITYAPEGLSEADAAARLASEGFNDLPSPEKRSSFAIVAEVVREPMFGLLLGAALLYALIGDLTEAAVLSAFATLSVSIAVIQRARSEKVLEALRDLSSPRALVIRGGVRRRIAGRDIARGDLMIVTEGDRVPADATLVEGEGIRIDESLLTGEAIPVLKNPAELASAEDSAQGSCVLSSGTLVVSGTGKAVVTATGPHSAIGKIGGSLRSIQPEPPRLQKQMRRLVVIFASIGLTLSAVAIVLYGLERGDWLQALLAGIALGMSMLPEEFPLVLTVFMVMGAWRLSQSRVLTRQAAAIETLGAATVLCTDKTGTLTLNAMSVVRLVAGPDQWDSTADATRVASSKSLSALLETAALASDREALDPMERAIFALYSRTGTPTKDFGPPSRVYPLQPQRLAVTHVYQKRAGGELFAAFKGAPETIANLSDMNAESRARLIQSVDALAKEGVRVLAVARGRRTLSVAPESPEEFEPEYLGLVGLADPLRPSVPDAVRECRSAGIRVVMITGDYPETARAIAREAGIEADDALSGYELDGLDDAQLTQRIRRATIFARIAPRQKLRIVQALKAAGEVVAMTGDGVNDAPALKAAHIGIAMGGRGTDVAREASSLVLLDDDFGSIVRAVRLGRRIYDNLHKALGYIVAVHVPIAGLALLPLVAGGPLILTPILIAFLELIIDPACSIVLEGEQEERNIMRRPPRNPRSPLLSRAFSSWSALQGILALLFVTGVFAYALRSAMSEDEVRALTFLALIGINIALILVNRSYSASPRALVSLRNGSIWWVLGIVGALVLLMIGSPAVRAFLHIGPLHVDDLAICLVVVVALVIALQAAKLAWGARLRG